MIRPYDEQRDWPGVWKILEPVFRAGETYAFPRDISSESAKLAWTSEPKSVFVAEDDDAGHILGTYYLKSNAEGPGSHVCNCGYVVSTEARGKGIASRMCEHSQTEARARGYRAMQFNLVVSTNASACRRWKSMGFEIVGTIPGGFQHPSLGFVDAYVMFKALEEAGFRSTPPAR